MRVLHVSDSYNAGVQNGIQEMVAQFPQHKHLLLWASHPDSPVPTSENLSKHFEQSENWKGGIIQKYLRLTFFLYSNDIDVIHLHSSIAGAIGRLIPNKTPKIYSPHCFAFQRRDISIFLKYIYLLIEFLLSHRSSVLGLCWPIEVKLSRKFFKKSEILFMPIIDLKKISDATLRKSNRDASFICVGRIRPQKDPLFLTSAIKMDSSLREKVLWVGTGDSHLIRALENSTVKVSSWLSKEEIWSFEKNLAATCITSSWESGPLTLFESISAGLPAICRSIDALDLYGFETYKEPIDFANAMALVLESDTYRESLFQNQKVFICKVFDQLSFQYNSPDPYKQVVIQNE